MDFVECCSQLTALLTGGPCTSRKLALPLPPRDVQQQQLNSSFRPIDVWRIHASRSPILASLIINQLPFASPASDSLSAMADEEERLKAEKLAAAKKRVAQLQKQKAKKAAKKAAADAEASKDDSSTAEPATPATPKEPDEKPDSEPVGQQEEKPAEPEKREEETATEPMPQAPTYPGPDATPGDVKELPSRGAHARQPSLSAQSKMRSSSFRQSSISQGAPAASSLGSLKSPPLPPLSPDGEHVHEVFRKQAARLEELEKENKRLEKELEEANARRLKSEEQLEDLREASVEVVELKDRLEKAEKQVAEIEKLKAEITSLQRQNSLLQSKSHRNTASVSAGSAESPPSDLAQQLESKSATIEAMEIEISNLRAQVQSHANSSAGYQNRISALEEKLAQSESNLEKTQRELADAKQSLSRAAEKAIKEGVDKTSTETLIKNLRREIEELQEAKSAAEKKIDTLDKKLQALGNLHKESESRHQARLREHEKLEKEVVVLKKKLTSVENENLRLKEERDRARKLNEAVGGDDAELAELEEEERARLERRIRELEGEIFDLRRGVWKEKRKELEGEEVGEPRESATSPGNTFDEVDLIGGAPSHSRRRSAAGGRAQQQQQQQQHSSFATVLSSGLAAFTGSGNRDRRPSQHPPATRGSLELLSEENGDDDDFDEEAFARAQAEEEARKRVEWVREVKRKLREWKGWRLDLVDSRAGAEGAGVGMGEIFEV